MSANPTTAVRGALHCLNFCVWLVIGVMAPFTAVWHAVPWVRASPGPRELECGLIAARHALLATAVSLALLLCSRWMVRVRARCRVAVCPACATCGLITRHALSFVVRVSAVSQDVDTLAVVTQLVGARTT